jgi:hypothetical protein
MRHFPKPLLVALLALPLAACGGGGGGGGNTAANPQNPPPSAKQIFFAGQQSSSSPSPSLTTNEAVYAAGTDSLQRLGTLSLSGGANLTNDLPDPSQQFAYFQNAPSGAFGGSTPTAIYDLATGSQSNQVVSNPFMGAAVDNTGAEYMYAGFPGQPEFQAYLVGAQGQLTAADAFAVNGVSLPSSFVATAQNQVIVAGEDSTAQQVDVGLYTLGTDPATQQNGYLSLVGSAQAVTPTAASGSSAVPTPLVYAQPGWGSAYVAATDSPFVLYGFPMSASSGLGTAIANPVTGPVAGMAASTAGNYIYTRSLATGNTGCIINGYSTSPSGQLSPINNGNPLFSQPQDLTCIVQFNQLQQSPAVIVSALEISQQTQSAQTVFSTFSVNADGTWTPTGVTTVPMSNPGGSPFGFVDPVNQRLFMVTPSGIDGWSIAPNGALTPIQNGTPLATPDSGMLFSSGFVLPN